MSLKTGALSYILVALIIVMVLSIAARSKIAYVLLLIIPLLPIMARAALLMKYKIYASELLSNDQKDSERGLASSLTMSGFALSGFFVLVATNPIFIDEGIDINIPAYFMAMSIVGYFGSAAIEAYKHTVWQFHLCVALDDMGKVGLLGSIASLAWLSQLEIDNPRNRVCYDFLFLDL